MKLRRIILLLFIITEFAILSLEAQAQLPDAPSSTSPVDTRKTQPPPDLTYTRPTHSTKFHNYLFDAFGPYPIIGSAIAAGINQAENTPPEWKQGAEGYGKRLGSDFAISAVSTTTRYALAEAFRQDTTYYRCECKGFAPRLGHAVLSTLTARQGADGHRVFSVPALVAPYAGTATAVYAWYPERFGARDAFRMGNYSLLGYVGGNLAREFLYNYTQSVLSRMHLKRSHGSPDSSSNP